MISNQPYKKVPGQYVVKSKPKTETWRCMNENFELCACCCPNACPSIAFIENWKKLDAQTEALK